MDLFKNIESVCERIKNAAEKSGRKASDINLVAVSKKVPIPLIQQAASFGLNVFGENRVEEAEEKIDLLPNLEWHLIGHLQSRKVKRALPLFKLIHSVDSVKLLDKINKEAHNLNQSKINVLLQLNLSGEIQKYGFSEEDFWPVVNQLKAWDRVSVMGLMTMAFLSEQPENSRMIFRKLKQIQLKVQEELKDASAFSFLSMGMSQDFEVAIEEGATHIRVGSCLFHGSEEDDIKK